MGSIFPIEHNSDVVAVSRLFFTIVLAYRWNRDHGTVIDYATLSWAWRRGSGRLWPLE